jgi:hypothetical protein
MRVASCHVARENRIPTVLHTLLAALAAKVVGRPVKVQLTRAQMYSMAGHQPATVQTIALGDRQADHRRRRDEAIRALARLTGNDRSVERQARDLAQRLARYRPMPGEIATTAAQQPLLDQVGQCASRLGIMLSSPSEEIGHIDHRTSFGSAAAINSPARATARPGAIGAAKTAPFSA